MPRKRDPLKVKQGFFSRGKEKKYRDPLDIAPTLNPLKLIRRWKKRKLLKKQ